MTSNAFATTVLLQAALGYAAGGWFVFPCNAAKAPLIRGGFKSATLDEQTITGWWGRWPNAAIGISAGPSHLLVFDADKKHGTDGVMFFEEFCREREIELAGAFITATPSGGRHYIYCYDHSINPISSSVGRVAPGVDVRGEGGYIIVPPSVISTGSYECLSEWSGSPITAPLELVQLAANVRNGTDSEDKKRSNASGCLMYQMRSVASTPEGGRNDQLNRAAFILSPQIVYGYLAEDEVVEGLTSAALEAGLTLEETQRTIQSGLQAGYRLSQHAAPSESIDDIICTDLGNSRLLVQKHGMEFRYCQKLGGWLVWDGSRWVPDAGHKLMQCAKEVALSLARKGEEAGLIGLEKWGRSSQSRARLEAMISLATSEPGIAIPPERFDDVDHLLNCMNGTLNLSTFKLQPHSHDDLLTKMSGTNYDPVAKCPLWLEFLHRITAGDSKLITYLQKAVGYSLTADTSEQCFFFLYGDGANGKSTFINTISGLMGDYAAKMRAESLFIKSSDGPNNDIARLRGARFVSASEMRSRPLNETLVKDITGGDSIAARFLFCEHFEFRPECKVWMYGNEKPNIKGTDEGIWRRVRLVPFVVHIPEEDQDRTLAHKLEEELPGILNWALEGLKEWRVTGLGTPPSVKDATIAFREEMDSVQQFIESECEMGLAYSEEANTLYSQYRSWAAGQGITQLKRNDFARALDKKDFSRGRDPRTSRHIRKGLRLRNELFAQPVPSTDPEA
ncbi:MAG TPA: phage/plasmid primase, P4 family [Candidatus Fermentibacter daniensis]|nr:phage/plasmid primase, P4 family [Candidatus Fermentibacter daniensis]